MANDAEIAIPESKHRVINNLFLPIPPSREGGIWIRSTGVLVTHFGNIWGFAGRGL